MTERLTESRLSTEEVDFSWAFILREGHHARTRLLTRARVRYGPRWTRALVAPVIGPADWINVAAMLRGIKRRVERAASKSKDGLGVGVDLAPASYGAEVRR